MFEKGIIVCPSKVFQAVAQKKGNKLLERAEMEERVTNRDYTGESREILLVIFVNAYIPIPNKSYELSVGPTLLLYFHCWIAICSGMLQTQWETCLVFKLLLLLFLINYFTIFVLFSLYTVIGEVPVSALWVLFGAALLIFLIFYTIWTL